MSYISIFQDCFNRGQLDKISCMGVGLLCLPAQIKFEVTEEDIKKGVHRSACSCPVSLALNRWLKNTLSKRCDTGWFRDKLCVSELCDVTKIYFDSIKGGQSVLYRNSKLLTEFVVSYDNGLEVKPGKFVMNYFEERF